MPTRDDELKALMKWYLDAGVDETIGNVPIDRYSTIESRAPAWQPLAPSMPPPGVAPPPAAPKPPPAASSRAIDMPAPRRETIERAVHSAADAHTLDDLRQALEAFEGCALKKTATNLVFGDGSPEAKVVFIGEAPGADEDRQGIPFVGPSGKLLDKMLASIGLDRSQVFISNTVFWRPPGNRSPTTSEVALCMPFVERMIEIIDPAVVVALGNAAAQAVFAEADSITRLRRRSFTYQTAGLPRPIPAMAMFHPAYLLRTPLQKRLAWRDLLTLQKRLAELAAGS